MAIIVFHGYSVQIVQIFVIEKLKFNHLLVVALDFVKKYVCIDGKSDISWIFINVNNKGFKNLLQLKNLILKVYVDYFTMKIHIKLLSRRGVVYGVDNFAICRLKRCEKP